MSPVTPAERALIEEAERAFLERGTVTHYEDAPFYQRTYQHRKMDVRWYVEHCEQAGGNVLELGCGTGRITVALARAGFQVTAVDAPRSVPTLETGPPSFDDRVPDRDATLARCEAVARVSMNS